jgi:hypothetical protein
LDELVSCESSLIVRSLLAIGRCLLAGARR